MPTEESGRVEAVAAEEVRPFAVAAAEGAVPAEGRATVVAVAVVADIVVAAEAVADSTNASPVHFRTLSRKS
jgi:hypothetical protein